MFEIALGLAIIVLCLLYYYFTSTFNYWKDKGVEFLKPYPLSGSMTSALLLKEHIVDFCDRTYKDYPNIPYVGLFQGRTPALLIRDTEIVKEMMVKDFAHFTDHGFTLDEDADPLQARNLFNMEGHKWKEMRAKLSPTFTSGRIKAMFPIVLECAQILEKYLDKLADTNQDLNIKDIMARYTTDVISSAAFGVKCDSINDPDAHFRKMGRRMFQPTFIESIKTAMVIFIPNLAKLLKLSIMPKEAEIFFRSLVSNVIEHRKTTGEVRKDFMQLLIELKDKGHLTLEHDEDEKEELKNDLKNGDLEHIKTDYKLTEDDVTAQATVFFIAGFETSSTALNYAFFELAKYPEIQQNARKEIEEVLKRYNGKITYDAMQEMHYLDFILQEALRKYPPLPTLNRVCTKNYKLPGTDLSLVKGDNIIIPIHAIQNDPKNFPDPERFNPDRFNKVEHANSLFLPFGEGPRQCIGLRFARMQSKLGLIHVLRNYEIKPSNKTELPHVWDPRQFLLVTKKDIYVKLTHVKKQ